MKNIPLIIIYLVFVFLIQTSCSSDIKKGDQLSRKQKKYIKELGLIKKGEEIILFDSQGGGMNGWKQSGNFFTDKRISAYWIDNDSTLTTIKSAYYSDIDTIWRYPKFNAWTLASYLEVHQMNGEKFKVYVGADSVQTWKFFNRALEEWDKQRKVQQRR
jgi:hypothetical protein